ncbi:N-[(2S)-2-amino-2-carboxyethyl]-L-glutamate dehydrogenase SbnB [Spirochaetia bacterium]|nr:N-[(2S)-2-amino-2-carboxyethyl]-L-glutamate dehydrogenase SbnB [Spirochaetia bacterium]GHU35345.1 N-[(2S)-2-amino-2-carboxyethyl]-L-glutamate dehydrogenase SbnB [Spirochaetia bacterium]
MKLPDSLRPGAEKYRKWILNYLDIGRELLYLSQDAVKSIPFTPEETRNAVEKALIAYSAGQVDMPSKIGVHPLTDTFFHAMPAYVPEQFAVGIKWGSCYPENRNNYGIPQAQGLIMLSDHLSGLPLAVLDCKYVTEIRTAAVTYTAIHYLAPKNVETFGMIGVGVEGRQHIKNILTVLPNLNTIYIYDVYEPASDALIFDFQHDIPVKIVRAGSYEELVKNAQVIVSATVAKEGYAPVILDSWVSKGKTILMCEGHTLYEDSIIKRSDKYIVDSREQTEQFKNYGYYPFGYPEIYAETGEIAAGKIPGREDPDELIIANNFGMAVEDMFVVRALFDRALEHSIGIKLPL